MQNSKITTYQIFKGIITLPSVWPLLVVNLFTIIAAVYQGWDFNTLIWIYFIQSLIIGFFQFLKIWTVKNYRFDNINFQVNGKKVKPYAQMNKAVAGFFVIHYGGFHAAYLLWLIQEVPLQNSKAIIYMGSLYFVNHLISFGKNFFYDSHRKKDLGFLMFFPYARIFPMHIFIVLGLSISGGIFSLIFFLVLKTFADIIMHALEHNHKVGKGIN